MRASTYAFASAALFGLACAGSIDNSDDVELVTNNAVDRSKFSTGQYTIYNPSTGLYLNFVRTGVNDFYPSSNDNSVQLEPYHDAFIISDGNGHCASSQWGFQSSDAFDWASVAYSCAIGSNSPSTSGIHIAKQQYYIIPTGSNDNDNDDEDDDDDDDDSDSSTTDASSKVAVSASLSSKDCDLTSVDSSNRTTWCCKHPGWWLAKHPGYVTQGGHVECKDDLAKYLASQRSRMVRRSKHERIAKSMQKRGQQTYTLVTADHLEDMTTRAIAAKAISTYGGQKSTCLDSWDPTNALQQWVIISA